MNGYLALRKIIDTIFDIFTLSPKEAREKYFLFPNFAEHISKLFHEERLIDIPERLEIQSEIVKKYNPPVRPALDPYVSTQIGVFNKNFSDWEIGHFLNYPDCCIKSFTEEIRYGIDKKHFKEIENFDKIILITAGFIPHSLFCKEALQNSLICILEEKEIPKIKKLEIELFNSLPHFHSEYKYHYYEIISNKILGSSYKELIT
ncbi:MAG: DUF483 domain-containing protein [Candidatus Methanomethylicia archaeon]|jgi:hypothetical protein|nr:DUF483 domain-containing protein [Candidatus Methanomethylicia archaeon]MCQ5340152.1 DUF483 domain-containing protein [Candidatus Methanomethylicia archaeon]NHV45549.1 DUF483 domain-containing protein [Candidatus Verstraetearchaeota archaeon]